MSRCACTFIGCDPGTLGLFTIPPAREIQQWSIINAHFTGWFSLPPANEVAGRLCFYTCVILFTGGGDIPACITGHIGIHPLGRHPPRADTPRQTPPPPGQTPPPPGRHPPRWLMSGGTHPTGMHSCFADFFSFRSTKNELK